MMNGLDEILAPDDFLERLGLADRSSALARDDRDWLFLLVIEFARARGEVSKVAGPPPPGSFASRIPTTSWHVRLGAPSKQELDTFVKLAGLIAFSSGVDLQALSAAALISLHERVAQTSTEHGERSVVDVILETGSATAADVVAALGAGPCLHKGAGCRFETAGTCRLSVVEAGQIAEALATRQILRRRNGYEPFEYAVAM